MKKGLLLSVLYAAAALWLLSGRYDPIGVVNAVMAERGGFAPFELVHPLYGPLLLILSKVLSAIGFAAPHMAVFQAVNVLFTSATVGLSFLLLTAAGLPALAAGAAALCAGFSTGSWYWAMQAKPYAPALFFVLSTLYLLCVPGKPGRGRLLSAAVTCALACSFTSACASMLPVFWFAIRPDRRGKSWARAAALFTAAWALCLALLYLPLLVLKWEQLQPLLSGGLFQALASVPGSGTLLASKSLSQQFSLFQGRFLNGNYALTAALFFGAAGLFFRRKAAPGERRIPLLAAAMAACLTVFILAADPHNDFGYSVTVLVILAGAGLGARLKALYFALPALAAFSIFFAVSPSLPGSSGTKDIYRDEAVFINSRLSAGDTLLCAGPPDWRLSYLLNGRIKLLQIDMGGNEGIFFAPKLVPPGDGLKKIIEEAPASGRRVLLAPDVMFQPDTLWTRDEIRARIDGAVNWLEKGFTLGEPEISPNGQYYYPVSPRKPRRTL